MTTTEPQQETKSRRDRRAERKANRSFRRRLGNTFTLVTLLSVVLLGVINYYQVRSLLKESITDQLLSIQATKAQQLRNGLNALEETVVLAARSGDVVAATADLSTEFESLRQQPDLLTADELAALDARYAETVEAVETAGLEAPAVSEFQPQTDAGKYLQFHYIVENPNPPESRSALVTAETDTSPYRDAHSFHHPEMLAIAEEFGFGDVLLVDLEGNIVYTTAKRIDLGTNAGAGPYRATSLGSAISTRLAAAPVGDAVFVDFERYLPARGEPALFIAAAVRQDAQTVGAVVVELPVDGLNLLLNQGGEWEEAGLGETGEVYVVGRDELMRSDSRLWLEDPDRYQRRISRAGFSAELGEFVELFDSTVLLQSVATEPVRNAFDGETFNGRAENYYERESISVASPVGADQVDWVIVAEVAESEANAPLRSYITRLIIMAAILIPLVALVAYFLADRVTRPVRPVVEAAAEVAEGKLDTQVPDLGRNEFGDVARRLNVFTADLRAQEEALAEEDREITNLLLSALPSRVVTELRTGSRTLHDLFDTATVIAFSIDAVTMGAGIDPETAVDYGARLSQALESLADDHSVERVRSSSDYHLFAAGLDSPDPAVSVATEFALRAAAVTEELSEELGITAAYRAGLSSGDVIASVLNVDQLTYGIFGDPPRDALALSAIADDRQILVDPATASQLGREWTLERAEGLLDLRGDPVDARVLVSGPVTVPSDTSPA